jgi:NADH-quinone oxidoreductase subunit F
VHKITKIDDFKKLRKAARQDLQVRPHTVTKIIIGMGTCGIAAGATEIMNAILLELKKRKIEANVTTVGCIGMCAFEPLVDIEQAGSARITYGSIKPADVPHLVEETLLKGRIVERLVYRDPIEDRAIPYYNEIPFYTKQKRIALRNCGIIDPENIKEYIAKDGYSALNKVLSVMTPQLVLDEIKTSGLRGRGGAGFPTGLKWEFTSRALGEMKYVICNADEGDPGAFMDRSIIEGDPYSLIEGMTIAAYAIGATEGYIYCRAEYPLAIKRLQKAIHQAEELGLLRTNIMGTGFDFHLYIKEGAGAFVCGEETALIASIEGRRGEPRPRPPFPAVSGLWGKPTNINNVKSYAVVPQIILNGGEWFAKIGSKSSPGTAIFALTGKVKNTGLVEVPMGTPLGEIIFDIGGGIAGGKKFKAVQTGGPLGGCIPPEYLDINVDFDSLRGVGAVMGSGGMIVVDEDTCMVEFAKFFLTFATAESCGNCIPCRSGGKRMLEILNCICKGRGQLKDLDKIREIAQGMESSALCALGQLTPGPVMAALRYFGDEFIAHIEDRRCPAGSCIELVPARCLNACPAGVDVPGYINLVAEGQYAEALEIHRERNPFAMICGRVCPAFCEKHCRRSDIDDPVAVRSIKRFMADHEADIPWDPPKWESPKNDKVAVIGSGPAGLTAGLRLAQMGYPVSVFEALPIPGGMMAVGIPEYRLPRQILNHEIESIKRAGVEIVFNKALGRDFVLDDLLNHQGYKSVILAIGAHKSVRLGIAGENRKGVYPGVDFLRGIALGHAPDLRNKCVAIVGGGNVAIDAARIAWRQRASQVHIIYRRTRQDMPAYPEEVEAAEDEGIIFHYLAAPIRVLGSDTVEAVVVQHQQLSGFDSSGRGRPLPVEGSTFTLGIDVFIAAIGQQPDNRCTVEAGLAIKRNATFDVNKYLMTSREGVFAAGDAVSGPASVIEAVAQGNRVAKAVESYLRTGTVKKVDSELNVHLPELNWDMEKYGDTKRIKPKFLNVSDRVNNFLEVELPLEEEKVRKECKRCLRCDLESFNRNQHLEDLASAGSA